MGEHNIVVASLPAGVYGTTSAATTACKAESAGAAKELFREMAGAYHARQRICRNEGGR
jgi:hypothetical protein